ncbi:MAG TPA: hypothetical protein VJQ79_06185 [Acidimicrobiia bacterium]|nr:hypothetical protein [Acidimicrobiia bacterium]
MTVEDGNLDFVVGDDILYKIVVYNFGPSDAPDLRIVDTVGPDGRGIACREIPDIDPTCPDCPDRFPNPRQGMVDGGTCSPSGFTWQIGPVEGSIAGLTAAVLYFRAEALEEGTAINRVELSGRELSFPVVIEEPTAIFAD